ncbi:MAG TPA: TonB-dependent receptor, partial [Chitinophagaceae bacterium]
EGETTVGTWKIDGGVFSSRSEKNAINGQYGFQTPDWRANNGNIAGTDNGTGAPIRIPNRTVIWEMPSYTDKFLSAKYIYNPPFGGPADDPSRFNFYTVDNNDHITVSKNFTARLNFKKDYFLSKKYASSFSFGFKGKFMNSDRHRPPTATILSINTITSTSSTDYGDTRLARFMHKFNQSSDFLSGNLNFGPSADITKIQHFMKMRPDRFILDRYRTDYAAATTVFAADEDVTAGYVMNKVQFKKVMAIVGIRFENTNVDYKANRVFSYNKLANPDVNGGQLPSPAAVVYDTIRVTKADSTLKYFMALPNVQLKFDVAKNLVLRTAWTTGYSRPNLQDLMPTLRINTDIGKIEAGNSQLEAAYSNNLDFLVEHYMKNVGILSGGLFYKHINKFQYLSEGPITDPANPYYNDNAPDQFVMTQPKNGKAANVFGVEVTLNSTLSFMPGFLRNLVFTSNYTYAHSKATTDQKRGELRLPGQADHTANIALGYSTKRFTLQASANYNGKFIYALGTDKETDLWVADRWQLDLNGNVKITKQLMFYAEVVNLLNSKTFTYMGNSTRVYELEYTDAYFRTGLSFRF